MTQALWPLLAALLLMEMAFGHRRPAPPPPFDPADMGTATSGTGTAHHRAGSRNAPHQHATGAEIAGAPHLRHLPPATLLSAETSHLVAFLIRNRGRIDNEVVRTKWARLDAISLPLAVRLRQIEAEGQWDWLEREIASTPPFPPRNDAGRLSWRDRRILGALPDWVVRGEELVAEAILSPALTGGTVDAPDPHPDPEEIGPAP